jgi:hypothetical protein
MLLFRAPERARPLHLRHNRPAPLAVSVETLYEVLRDPALLLRVIEDRRAVRLPNVVALTVGRRGIVHPKEIPQELLKRQTLPVEDDPHGFGMPRMMTIRRVGDLPARVADISVDDAGNLSQNLLHPPEAASG